MGGLQDEPTYASPRFHASSDANARNERARDQSVWPGSDAAGCHAPEVVDQVNRWTRLSRPAAASTAGPCGSCDRVTALNPCALPASRREATRHPPPSSRTSVSSTPSPEAATARALHAPLPDIAAMPVTEDEDMFSTSSGPNANGPDCTYEHQNPVCPRRPRQPQRTCSLAATFPSDPAVSRMAPSDHAFGNGVSSGLLWGRGGAAYRRDTPSTRSSPSRCARRAGSLPKTSAWPKQR